MLNDLWYAMRALRKSPGFALAAILTLAVAIAADCVVFSVADAVLFRPLPYKDAGRLYHVWWGWKGHPATFGPSMPDYLDWKRRNSVFEDMALTGNPGLQLKIGESVELIDARAATGNLFDLLGVKPALGRTFSADELVPGLAYPAVLVSYDFWQSRLNGDPNVLGRMLTLDGHQTPVVGVLPAGFQFTYPRGVQLWVPRAANPAAPRGNYGGLVTARLKPGVTPAQATAAMKAVLADLAREYPATDSNHLEAGLMSIRGWMTRQVRPILITLLGAVTFVLLIGCANVANLALARLTDRERETTVRAALGAGRWRLVREFLAESLVVALTAGALGLLLSSWGLDFLRSMLPPELPRGDEVHLDARVACFALALSLATTLAFGLLPALKCSKLNLVEGLAGSTASLGGRRGKGVRMSLVVAETALALVLTGGAGLMMNSFIRLMRVDLGFNPKNVLAANAEINRRSYPTNVARAALVEREMEAVRAIPGVRQVGVVDIPPLLVGDAIVSFPPAPGAPPFPIWHKTVAGDYFGAMQVPLRAGRVFTTEDTERSEQVAVVNASLARLLYPNGGAVGRLVFGAGKAPNLRIVGVVADGRNRLFFPPEPEIYRPATQTELLFGATLVLRYEEAGKANLAGLIRQRLSEIVPDAPISVRSFEEAIALRGAQLRFLTALIVGAGALGLLLAASGVFGVTAYGVNRRTRELGVRIAIGAAPGDVLRMIVGEAILMAGAGAAIGTAAVLALRSVLRSLLFDVGPSDPLTLTAVIAVLAAVIVAASYVPARRVLKIDPAAALRHE